MVLIKDQEIAGVQLLKLITEGKDVGAAIRKDILHLMLDGRILNVKSALIAVLQTGLRVRAEMTLPDALSFIAAHDKDIEKIAEDIEREIARS
jgi:hypothetical protein